MFLLQVISEIIETARSHDFTDVIFVSENRGKPDGLIISHLPFGPTAYFQLLNVVSTSLSLLCFEKYFALLNPEYPFLFLGNKTWDSNQERNGKDVWAISSSHFWTLYNPGLYIFVDPIHVLYCNLNEFCRVDLLLFFLFVSNVKHCWSFGRWVKELWTS